MIDSNKQPIPREEEIEIEDEKNISSTNDQLDPNQTNVNKVWNMIPKINRIKLLTLVLIFGLLFTTIIILLKKGIILKFLTYISNLGHSPAIPAIIISICLIFSSLPVILLFSIMEISSGFLFGMFLGIPLVVISGTIGAIFCFSICRYFFRSAVKKKIDENPFFKKLDIRLRNESWKICFLIRLSPLPIGWVNAFLSVTKIDFFPFVVTTLIGIIPQVTVGVLAGSTMESLTMAVSGEQKWSNSKKITFAIEIIFFLTIFIVLFFVGRKIVKDTLNMPDFQHHLMDTNNDTNDSGEIDSEIPLELISDSNQIEENTEEIKIEELNNPNEDKEFDDYKEIEKEN